MLPASFGWNADHTRHVLPGRLLTTVPGLLRNPSLAAAITATLTAHPAVRKAQASVLTGRVQVAFDPVLLAVAEIETYIEAGLQVAAGGRINPEAAADLPGATETGIGAPSAPQRPVPAEPWHVLPLAEVYRTFEVRPPRGLSERVVADRLQLYGPNTLRSSRPTSMGELVLHQLKNPITLLLLGAGGVSLVVAQWLEAAAALSIASLTTYIGVRQESRASQALASLGKLAAPRAVVVRGGSPATVPAEQVVPGDLIMLEEGDRVPADARLVFSAGLQVDESALTGESVPAMKDPNLRCSPATPLADRSNMLYAGTTVVSGRAQAVVVATGMETEVGHVALLLEEGSREVTLLQRRLQHLAHWIFWGVLGIGVVGTVTTVARGVPLGAALAQSISVAISAMPQGLPVTVTIALSTAVTRLAEHGAMTRRLGAMECLGSTTVICSDKTGTLTMNQLTVREMCVAGARWEFGSGTPVVAGTPCASGEADLVRALTAAALCTNARLTTQGPGEYRVEGDATEGALLIAAARAGIDPTALHGEQPRLHEVPFSAETRRMSVVCQTQGGPLLCVKGAPEAVLPMCTRHLTEAGEEVLHGSSRRAWLAAAEAMAGQGLRVLAIASRPQEHPVVAAEQGLTLLGFAGMVDAPRPGVRAAVERCREAGIRVLMLTGDHPATAAAIGREVGILKPNALVLTGPELDRMDDAELAAAMDRLAICARVAPEHKLRVVKMLKRRGEVVAMTGDGVNDAPALQAADTGIAMGIAGTEVTRGAANLVLTNDDFGSIVKAVEQGRSAYSNIRRALTYSLSTNGGEALMALLPLAVGLMLPVPAAMLLITNMLCDGLVSLSLATDPPETGVMTVPPRPMGEPVLGPRAARSITVRGVAIGATTVALYTAGLLLTGMPGVGYSMALAGLVGSKLLFAYSIRRRRIDGTPVTPGPNKLLTAATVLGGGVTLAAIYVPQFSALFGMAPLGLLPAGIVALVVYGQHRVAGALTGHSPSLPAPPAPDDVLPSTSLSSHCPAATSALPAPFPADS